MVDSRLVVGVVGFDREGKFHVLQCVLVATVTAAKGMSATIHRRTQDTTPTAVRTLWFEA